MSDMFSIADLLITPSHFFRELGKEEADLKYPVLIVLIIGIISGISAYIVSGKTMAMMPAGMEGAATFISLIGFAAALIGSFIYWIIWVVAILIMIYILKGELSFKKLMEIVGYGFVPQIFGTIISTGIMITSLPNLVIPSTSNVAEMETALNVFMVSPPMMTAMIIGIIFTIWSAYIWIFGVKELANLDFKKAALCTGIPVAVYVLITVGSLFV